MNSTEQMELAERIFESFYICNEMNQAMARDYAERAASIAAKMARGEPRVNYFTPAKRSITQ